MIADVTDFISMGAGSAGCVLAIAYPRMAVVPPRSSKQGLPIAIHGFHLSIGYGKTMWDKRVNWAFYTEPDPNMNGRAIYWPRGKMLGGTSSIDGLIAIRGQRQDYDYWQRLGCTDWSWRDVLPYFRKLENKSAHETDQLHGAHGPMTVTSIKQRHELIEAVIRPRTRWGYRR